MVLLLFPDLTIFFSLFLLGLLVEALVGRYLLDVSLLGYGARFDQWVHYTDSLGRCNIVANVSHMD